jgi:hypothetical protein
MVEEEVIQRIIRSNPDKGDAENFFKIFYTYF